MISSTSTGTTVVRDTIAQLADFEECARLERDYEERCDVSKAMIGSP
jgi:hypothetical protein